MRLPRHFLSISLMNAIQNISPHTDPVVIWQLICWGFTIYNGISKGKLIIELLDDKGGTVNKKQSEVSIGPYGKLLIPAVLTLPERPGGYVIVAEYYPAGKINPVIMRRFIKIGECEFFNNYEIDYMYNRYAVQ